MPQFHSLDPRDDSGQTMTEMGVVMALIFLVVLVAIVLYSARLSALWAMLSSNLPGGG
jgi:Flp pilus assembly pilin Flp